MKKKFLAGILSFMLAVQPAAICQAEEVAGSFMRHPITWLVPCRNCTRLLETAE